MLTLIGFSMGFEGFRATSAALLVAYMILFGVLEAALAQSIDVREEAARKAGEAEAKKQIEAEIQRRKIADSEAERYAAACECISNYLQKANRGLNSIFLKLQSEPELSFPDIKKLIIINDMLQEMCVAFRNNYCKLHEQKSFDVMFRATYMEVHSIPTNGSTEILEYGAWYTPDGSAPRSMSQGVRYQKREGVAGIAWERKQPVIEDRFEDGKEWKNNYPKHGARYKSMVCVPVLLGDTGGQDTVIGIVTVDTSIPGFFGSKDSRPDEQAAGAMIQPYATYIAFVSVFDKIANAITEKHKQAAMATLNPS